MKRLLFLGVLAFCASQAFAQVSPPESNAEHTAQAQSRIPDTVVLTSGPTVEEVTEHSATLRWTTNKTAATRVNYGTDPNRLVQHAYRPGGSTGHEVVMQNLQPHTTYYYEIENRYGRDRLTGNFTTQ